MHRSDWRWIDGDGGTMSTTDHLSRRERDFHPENESHLNHQNHRHGSTSFQNQNQTHGQAQVPHGQNTGSIPGHQKGKSSHRCTYEGCGKTFATIAHMKRHLKTREL